MSVHLKSQAKTIGGVLLLSIFVIVPLYLAINHAKDTFILQTQGERVEGTVTSVHDGNPIGRSGRSPRYTVRYVGGDGTTYQEKLSSPLFTLGPEYSTGDTVTVIHQPNDPETATIDRRRFTWITSYLLSAFIGAFGLAMILPIVVIVREGKHGRHKK